VGDDSAAFIVPGKRQKLATPKPVETCNTNTQRQIQINNQSSHHVLPNVRVDLDSPTAGCGQPGAQPTVCSQRPALLRRWPL
jgi:hypothetical protein